MDTERFDWDTYSGKNGHEWAKYQRRNFMVGAYRFNGHRGDLMDSSYLATLANNPCYVASSNNSRFATYNSVPDINVTAAKDLWADVAKNRFITYKNHISSYPAIYADLSRNFDYFNNRLSLEVPDGAAWGNSTSTTACATGNWKGQPYPSASDQQFLLVDHSAKKIKLTLPGKRFQCYAYSSHADVPSSSISIDSSIDIQVVASAFQMESSEKGLMNRWYNRHKNISEYHYLNIPQWGGELPQTSYSTFEQSIQRIRTKRAQGITIETSPAKFSSLPLLYSANLLLNDSIAMQASGNEFINAMFPGTCGNHIRQLLGYWGNNLVFTVGEFYRDNMYKIPLYLNLLQKASTAAIAENAGPTVMARLREMKAYVHYMSLYQDHYNDRRSVEQKANKARNLCRYLASINSLQLVNSYFLIQDILWKYPAGHQLWQEFDIQEGSEYQNLAPITSAKMDQDFADDLQKYGLMVTGTNLKMKQKLLPAWNKMLYRHWLR
jgi:hypothetical protein